MYINKKDEKAAQGLTWCKETYKPSEVENIQDYCSSKYNKRAIGLISVFVNGKKLWSYGVFNVDNADEYLRIKIGWYWTTKKDAIKQIEAIKSRVSSEYDSKSTKCDMCGKSMDQWKNIPRKYCDGSTRLTGGTLGFNYQVYCPSCSYENDIKSVMDAMDDYEERTGKKVEELFKDKSIKQQEVSNG